MFAVLQHSSKRHQPLQQIKSPSASSARVPSSEKQIFRREDNSKKNLGTFFFQISRLRKRDSRMWKIWIESQFGKKDLITICKQKEKWKKISILCKIKILLRFWWRLFLPTILIWLIDRRITFPGISMVSGLNQPTEFQPKVFFRGRRGG